MKIQQLLKREPFGEIIEKTLSKFLSDYYKATYKVTWKKHIIFRTSKRGHLNNKSIFYCNPYINLIFSETPGELVIDFIRENYTNTPLYYKRFLQKIYIRLITNIKIGRYLCTHYVEISPSLPSCKNIVFLGGNNRIRMLDLEAMLTWDILKWRFDQKYILSELAVKNQPGSWPFPYLRSVAKDGTWYKSEYVHAVSLNRLDYKKNHLPFLVSSLKTLESWLDLSVLTSNFETYVGNITKEIIKLVENAPLFNENDSIMIHKWLGIIGRSLQKQENCLNISVELAKGHGDFQSGNILVDSTENVWIVDWEHSQIRQFAYDYFVFALQSRYPKGLTRRIQEVIQNETYFDKLLPYIPPRLQKMLVVKRLRVVSLLLFLLEELLWNIQENTNSMFTCQSGSWLLLQKEMPQALKLLGDACSQNVNRR